MPDEAENDERRSGAGALSVPDRGRGRTMAGMATPADAVRAPQPATAEAVARAPAASSLRAQLLKALATPLFALVLGSGMIAYWLATHYTGRVFDRALYQQADNIARQAALSGARIHEDLPKLARALLDHEGSDRVHWRIDGPDGLIAGAPERLGYGSGTRAYREGRLFYAWHDGRQVRVVTVSVEDIRTGADPGASLTVEIAETLDQRQRASNEILLAVSIPLFLLLALGSILLSVILKRELVLLQAMADALNRQSAQSLEAVDEGTVPSEFRPLTHAMNALLARLRKALDAQRNFISDAAHQLRTPLTGLKLHADRIAAATSLEAVRPSVRELQHAADRAVRLSNQLLSLARAESGEPLAQFARLDAAALAFEVGAEWVPRALERGIDLGFEAAVTAGGAPQPLWVNGNAVLLREALTNLIDNAVKYVPGGAGSQINVRACADGPQARIVIEDNGPGIPRAQRSDIFRRFFRADHQGVGGVGLGLAIAHDVIAQHGGTIRIEDGIGGAGTRFVIHLPRCG